MDGEAEISFRRDLENAGEAAVRADYSSGGGLSTGGEDRRKIIRDWLREQEQIQERNESQKQKREQESERREQERERREKISYRLGWQTFWIALGTLVAAVIGVIATILHK
jgi:Na+/glutamate symporter